MFGLYQEQLEDLSKFHSRSGNECGLFSDGVEKPLIALHSEIVHRQSSREVSEHEVKWHRMGIQSWSA